MANKIFSNILENQIKKFVSDFSIEAEQLFYDSENKLFHPGEYGKFREETVKQLLQLIVPQSYGISDGFIINAKDECSKQCDIIIFDKESTPIIKDDRHRFFPVEGVVGIGEIKSTLSKSDFITAIKKLAKNKSLKSSISGWPIKRGRQCKGDDFDPKVEPCDSIFSFMICKKLDFEITDLELDDVYKGIECHDWHNLILSIEDGMITYSCIVEKHRHGKKGTKISKCYPMLFGKKATPYIRRKENDNPYEHIKYFISELFYGIFYATILYTDILPYYSDYFKTMD